MVPAGAAVKFRVQASEAAMRLDALLAARLGISGAEARRLLERGAVRVDGRTCNLRDKGTRPRLGATVDVAPAFDIPEPQPDLPLTILAQGPGWVAVDKPAGMPVHPLGPGERGTALNFLVAHHPQIVGVGEGGLRGGVVHRLDVETSGALLFATDQPTWDVLRASFAGHTARKIYRAVVRGEMGGDGRCDLPLRVARHRPALVRVGGGRGSRMCGLRWRAVQALRDATLVEVELETGFLHQIRVTFAHLGHPVLGDRVYGAGDAARLMLHASRVQAGPARALSPDPGDFAQVVRALLV